MQNVLFNGVVYQIPDVGEDNYGQNLTDYFVALPSGALQKTAGNFTITAELNFGASFGLKAAYYASRAANSASAGLIRLSNTDLVYWRNTANDGNLGLGVNSSDQLTYNGVPIAASTALTANRAIVSSGTGLLIVSAVTATELGYVSGVTSSIQTQIDSKAPIASPTFTGTVTGSFSGPLSGAVTGNLTGNVTGNVSGSAGSFTGSLVGDVTGTQGATAISAATVTGKAITGYTSGSGVVSASDSILQAIQKLNGNDALKAPIASPTFTGTVTAPAFSGPLTGNVNGNLTGNVTGNVSGTALNVTGTVAIANGGTGQTSKATAFDALSPMTTSGDVIYGGASGTGTRLAKGSDGNVLTLASGLPTWSAPAAGLSYSWSGYHTVASGWAATSSAFGDFSAGTTVVLTQRQNANFGTVTTAGSSLPGIVITPPVTGNYYVIVTGTITSTGVTANSLRLIDSNAVIIHGGLTEFIDTATAKTGFTLSGIVNAPSTSALTVKVQGATSSATLNITNGSASGSSGLEWTVFKIN